MRLICPNCDAQYEVPVEMIPEAGRDVQCSNCGHTWYQTRAGEDAIPAAKPPQDQNQPVQADTEEAPAPAVATPPAPAPAQPSLPSVQEDDGNDDPDAAPPAADSIRFTMTRSRPLAPSVAEVLRQEAERESRQRANEVSNLESQPELGLEQPAETDETDRRIRESREFMVRMQRTPQPEAPQPEVPKSDEPEPDEPVAKDVTAPAAQEPEPPQAAVLPFRRDLLPDVGEINQSLRHPRAQGRFEPPQDRTLQDDKPRGTFALGFVAVLILAALMGALYAFAPQIGETLPAAKPALAGYVDMVDQIRLWLDSQLSALWLFLDNPRSTPPPPTEG